MKTPHLALVFKDFAAWCRSSCVGLNVAGFATAEVLRDAGIDVTVFPVRHNVDLVHAIDSYNQTHEHRLTHVVISAPWLSIFDLQSLLYGFPEIHFAILSHSNVGFLQADPEGVRLLRKYHQLSKEFDNFTVGGNCDRFAEWMNCAYGESDCDIVHLPNLYPIWTAKSTTWTYGTLKIGAFGAVRPYKNFMTAAGAAIAMQRMLGVPVEFHMSAGGEGDDMVAPAIAQIFEGTGVTLVTHPWRYWDDFIQLIGTMDILLQPSYTESFNMVTADGILQGVPSVVGPAIRWAPDSWKADPDDAMDVARVAMDLLFNRRDRMAGLPALREHNEKSLHKWATFLGLRRLTFWMRMKKLLDRLLGL